MVRGGVPGAPPCGGDRAVGYAGEPMRDLLSSLLGVPAAALIAAGIGLAGVTVWSRLRRRPDRPPIRWAHLMLGVGLFGMGALLLQADVALLGVR